MPDTSVKVSVLNIPDYSVTFCKNTDEVNFQNHTLSGDFSLSRFYSIYEMFSDLGKSDFSTLKNASKKHFSHSKNNTTVFISKKTYLPEKITHTNGDTIIFTKLK